MEAEQLPRLDRDFVQDPHPLYRRLRAEAAAHPVVMWGGVRVWLVTRYAEARALLNDPRLSKDQARALVLFPPGTNGSHASSLNSNMLLTDPPDHTRLRRLVIKAFTARAVEQRGRRIERITDELLDEIAVAAVNGGVDLMGSFAAPLPIRVIGELLGVPAADRDNFRGGVESVLTTTDPDELRTALTTLTTLLRDLISRKRVTTGR